MAAFKTILFAIYFFSTSAILFIVACLVCLFTAPFDPKRKLVHMWSCCWGFHYVAMNPFWRYTFEGRENIKPGATYVFVSNHQSLADIVVLYGLFVPYKWVSKDSILKVPFIGGNMRLNQYVTISRGNLKSIKEMLEVCRQWLRRGASLMMFPEGTRSPDGQLQSYKDGAFRLSVDCGVPVIPIVLDGTHKILPKNSRLMCFESHIKVKVLPPVNPQDFGNDACKMRDYVHNLSKTTLESMRGQSAVIPHTVLSPKSSD